jgi:16S rRNA G966 N2-methylase RsmD
VFVDPPYRSDLAVRAVLAIPPANLATDVVIVIEHDKRNPPPDELGSLLRTDQRRYGDTLVSFYRVRT